MNATSISPSPAEHASPYLESAFYSQYNLILLGGSALFSLASASPLPLALGAGAEAIWLLLGPRLPLFRRRVDARRAHERRARLDDELLIGMRSLRAEHTTRLLALGRALAELSTPAGEFGPPDPELSLALSELEQLPPSFLRLCQLQERLTDAAHASSAQAPEQDVVRFTQALAVEKDLGMRLTLRQALNLAQRKIEQQARLIDLRRTVELKLTLIEQTVMHVRSQKLASIAPPALARELRSLLAQVASSNALEAEAGEAAASSGRPHPG